MNIQKTPKPDFTAIKTKQNAAWASGDYAVVGVTLQIVGETLAEAMGLRAGSKVLDVAAGNGNATLAFARRWHDVTSTDYVQALLDKGAARAKAEQMDVTFQVADAENLPFKDGSFDAVVSTYGVMFAPDQTRAAAELMRVCAPGGKIGLANWTPDGFIGQLFKTLGGFVAPPPGVQSPANWGAADWLGTHFADAQDIDIQMRDFVFHYRSPEHFIDVFRTLYGPVHKAFLALEPAQQAELQAAIINLIARFNTAEDGTVRIPSGYAEVVITK